MKQQVIKIAAFVIAFIGGIMFIVMGMHNLSAIKTFHPVDVTVTNVDTFETTDSDGLTTTEFTYYVSYNVEGQEYEGIVLQYAEGDLQEGDTVSALYDPENPAYVTNVSKKGGYARIAFGVVVLIGTVLGAFQTLVRGR